ncbi:PepSY domain-containing protein [Cellvibrio japonicus]|nr:hypothetical protein [Cellvibrio japonicus]
MKLCCLHSLSRSVAIYLLLAVGACAVSADDFLEGDLGVPAQSKGANNLMAPKSSEPAEEFAPPRLSPADAAQLVRDKTGGQVMSVSTRRTGSGTIYGVKILNAGRMRVIHVDGQTGELLSP